MKLNTPIVLEKIISGGQIGVDLAALFAAKDAGFLTGGFAAKDFKTAIGILPELKEFGLIDSGKNYQERTKMNVLCSDATFIFALNPNSPGTKCVKKIKSKPILIQSEFEINGIVDFISNNNVKILNVGGNRDLSQNQELFEFYYTNFFNLFLKLKELKND